MAVTVNLNWYIVITSVIHFSMVCDTDRIKNYILNEYLIYNTQRNIFCKKSPIVMFAFIFVSN